MEQKNNRKNKVMTKKEINKSFVVVFAVLIISFFALLFLNISNKEKEVKGWDDTEYGDFVVSETTEEVEVIPENIFDAYGLEYE